MNSFCILLPLPGRHRSTWRSQITHGLVKNPEVSGEASQWSGVERRAFGARSGTGKRTETRWRQMLVLAGAAMLLAGCSDYWLVANLKDNPMDQAIDTLIEADHMRETRDRILKRFPLGQPAVQLKLYLESVGAKCRASPQSAATANTRTRYSARHSAGRGKFAGSTISVSNFCKSGACLATCAFVARSSQSTTAVRSPTTKNALNSPSVA